MKDFSVVVTPESNTDELVAATKSRIAAIGAPNAQDQLVMDDLIQCIEDYIRRAKELSGPGTVLRIEKSFQFSFVTIVVRLAAPDPRGVLERLLHRLGGNI